MITSLILAAAFLRGIYKRLVSDSYYRALGTVTLIMLVIGTLVPWLVGGWHFTGALLYAVTTMSMNTPYSGPLTMAAGPELQFFHMGYTFLSVGVFIIFTLETGKTMLATHEHTIRGMAERRERRAAAKRAAAAAGLDDRKTQ